LEGFAKFGTRLDDATRKTIDHGQRIRACLKQSESQPLSMVEQICVLLALTAGLLDPVPLEKMYEAQEALQKAAIQIPADIIERLTSAEKLSDTDRKAILEVASKALASFIPKLEPQPTAKGAS
jgi:F-type H+-transporting ATPase subunit alpha